jgi:hypothetical protein
MTRIGFLLGALALACASHTIGGRSFSFEVHSDMKQVASGHWTGPFVNHGVCLNNVGQKEEEAGVLTGTGTFDGVWTSPTEMTSCTSKGQNVCTYLDGSTHTDEWTATCRPGAGGHLIFEGKGTFVSGTGRFEGISGTISWTSWNLSAPPENIGYSKVITEYTLPKK